MLTDRTNRTTVFAPLRPRYCSRISIGTETPGVDPALLGVCRGRPTAAGPAGAEQKGGEGEGANASNPVRHSRHRRLSFSSDTSPFGGPDASSLPSPAVDLLGLALLARPPAAGRLPAPAAPTDAFLDADVAPAGRRSPDRIWDYSETALKETKSAALLADVLEKEGFTVTRGVAGMPTAFVASAGSRRARHRDPRRVRRAPRPLAEGGRGEEDAARRRRAGPRVRAQPPRHRRGRRRRGREPRRGSPRSSPGRSASSGRRPRSSSSGRPSCSGTVSSPGPTSSSPGTPSRRTTSTRSRASRSRRSTSSSSGRRRTPRRIPGSAGAPSTPSSSSTTRSSLMREHVLPTARLHRVIKDGGLAANIIPDYARVQWFVRDTTGARVNEMLGRIRKAADGAALATETTAKVTLLASTREPIYNEALSRVRPEAARARRRPALGRGRRRAREGDPEGGRDPRDRPREQGPSLGARARRRRLVRHRRGERGVPLAELVVATGPAGSPWHHWDVASCAREPDRPARDARRREGPRGVPGGPPEGPETVAAAKAEFAKSTGGKPYVSPLAKDAVPKTY